LHDPRGFLWVGSVTALARFDGERFTNYGPADGLDVGTGVNHLTIGPGGELWIATNGSGIYRFDVMTTEAASRFTHLRIGGGRPSNRVNTMAVGPDGRIWAGTDAGLFVGTSQEEFRRLTLPVPPQYAQETLHIASLFMKGSTMWVGGPTGAFRCDLTGTRCDAEASGVRFLAPDSNGHLWAVRGTGVERWELDDHGLVVRRLALGGSDWQARRMIRTSGGMLMITEDRRIVATDGRTEQVLYASPDASRLNDIEEDASGNLWVATNAGLMAIRRQGVTLFTSHRDLREPYLGALVRGRLGLPPYVANADGSLHMIDGSTVTSARMLRPAGHGRSLWPDSSLRLDGDGDAWLGTGQGLFRFSKPAFSATQVVEATAARKFTTADGLAGNHIAEVFADSNGDVWIANVPSASGTLSVLRHSTARVEKLGVEHGLSTSSQLGGFVEDRQGTVWARLREGGIVRIRDDRVTVFTDPRLPPLVSSLFFDHKGSLWVGGSDSVWRVDDPAAEMIQPAPVLTGLGSTVTALGEDQAGLIFVGTLGGLLAFNPADRRVKRYSSFDGLPRGGVDAIAEGTDGAQLLISGRTLTRLQSWERSQPAAPRCVVTAIRAGGQPIPLPAIGLEHVDGLEVQPSQNQVEIELVGLSPRLGEPLAYEYRIPGVSEAWARAAERRVAFAGLASGHYDFEARVVGADASAPSPVATVKFRVLPPWYRRWWFLCLAGAATALLTYAAHRARLAQAVRTERLRSRIATDLHDDIGSSLSQIAILAEVARRRAGVSEPGVAEPLASIATTSRDLVDAMSDIVWAVNPRTDALSDLTRRMHRFAEETLGGADIALTFSAPPEDVDLKIGADLRREIYLMLKESVNNIARHSGASKAVVELTLGRHELRLVIADNGQGFDPGARADGNGIASMRKRAAAFGGVWTIDSAAGQGTRVSLIANLRRQVL
jgi:signal transduction histidine kinase/ligand-binding sensor domain-containing protein